MSKNAVRGVGGLVVLIGIVMLLNVAFNWGFQQALFNVLRALHLILALAFIGLYEASLSRSKGTLSVAGRQLGLVGRVLLTFTLVVGLYLLLTHFVDALGGYDQVIWVHGVIALISFGLVEMALSGRRVVSR